MAIIPIPSGGGGGTSVRQRVDVGQSQAVSITIGGKTLDGSWLALLIMIGVAGVGIVLVFLT